MRNFTLYILVLAFTIGCASSKLQNSDIDAYDRTILLAHKLKHKPQSQHLWKQIVRSYPEAVAWFESEMAEDNSNNKLKLTWTNTCSLMMRVNAMSDSIQAIPGWENHISGLRTYTSELDSAKVKAVSECIQQAQFLNRYNSRATLRIALFYLDQADSLGIESAEVKKLREEISEKIKLLPTNE